MAPEELIETIRERFGDAVLGSHTAHGDATVVVTPEELRNVCQFARDEPQLRFELLLDVTAVDLSKLPEWETRFELVVHLRSIENVAILRIKVPVGEEDPRVPSVTKIYPAANWFEREVYDMFGIEFDGHPDLRRILLYDEFEGHPLRKDYPFDRQHPLVPLREAWTPGIAWKLEERWGQYARDRGEPPA